MKTGEGQNKDGPLLKDYLFKERGKNRLLEVITPPKNLLTGVNRTAYVA